MQHPEHILQCQIIAWARMHQGPLGWLYSNPNGAAMPKKKNDKGQWYSPEAIRQVKAGMLAGVPDLFLPYPAHNYHGFFIELKAPGKMSTVREGQKEFMAWAESVGYLCQVHDSFDGCVEALEWYVNSVVK